MGFVSQGKGFGSTFFFELPVYSAAFAGKEFLDVPIGPTVPGNLGSNNLLESLSSTRSIKPTIAKIRHRKVITGNIHVQVSESDVGKDCDCDEVEEYWPTTFDNVLSQEKPSEDVNGMGSMQDLLSMERMSITLEDSRGRATSS